MANWWSSLKGNRWAQALANVGIAEALSAVVVILAMKLHKKHPAALNGLEAKIADKIVLPRLEKAEAVTDRFGYTKPCKERAEQTREERARKVAAPLTELAVDGAIGLTAGYLFQKLVDRKMGTGFKNIGFARVVDGGVQLGAIALLGTVLNKPRQAIASDISSLLQKVLKMEKKSADRFANYAVVIQIANFLGAATKIGMLATGLGVGQRAAR